MRPRAITTLGAWSSAQAVTWCCSSKTIQEPPARIWNSFLRRSRLIGAPGSLMNRLRKAMAVSNGVRSPPVLIEIAYLHRDWGEVGQVFRVERERKSRDKHSLEVVYGWASLSQKRCSPQRLAQLIRAHWAVENRLNFRRDATDGAKIIAACATRKSAQMLAVRNFVVLSLMDLHHVANVARQIRRFASHPDEALAWVRDF